MKTEFRKIVSALLTLALVIGLFAGAPLTAGAADIGDSLPFVEEDPVAIEDIEGDDSLSAFDSDAEPFGDGVSAFEDEISALAQMSFSVSNETQLAAVFDAVDDMEFGDIANIRLLADFTYHDEIRIRYGKIVTFTLNGKILNVTGGLIAESGAKILIADPMNGELNARDTDLEGSSFIVYAGEAGSIIQVTSIFATKTNIVAAAAYHSGELIVFDYIAFGEGVHGTGVQTCNSGEVTVLGSVSS